MADGPAWRDLALAVLETADPVRKCALALSSANVEISGPGVAGGGRSPPVEPARPARPVLVDPTEVPRRNLATDEGKVALLHALAHIEFNAVDLAFDMAIRFAGEIDAAGLAADGFVRDWFAVGRDEARHFGLLADRLRDLGAVYGDLPAHGALWDAAHRTTGDVLARLAVAPLVLEARGLDVAPAMAQRLRLVGDEASALILGVILEEEIGHVRTGSRWFRAVCGARSAAPEAVFFDLVDEHFPAGLKPPFNHPARRQAELPDLERRNWNEVCDAPSRPR